MFSDSTSIQTAYSPVVLKLMLNLNHDNVMAMLGVVKVTSGCYLLMDRMTGILYIHYEYRISSDHSQLFKHRLEYRIIAEHLNVHEATNPALNLA